MGASWGRAPESTSERLTDRLARRARVRAGHRLFALSLVAAALARAVAVIGYRPANWFNDSYEYVGVALRPAPYVVRPSGYSFFLRALEPFHSFQLVVWAQHLLGLLMGVAIYALLRRHSFAAWSATLAAAPVMFDGYQLQLEHLVLSETLYTALVVAAAASLLWDHAPRPGAAALAGACLAGAAVTRSIGLPLALAVGVWLLARRPGWRACAAFGCAFALPLGSYCAWHQAENGSFATSGSAGIFLYSRTAPFADCARMDPPDRLRVLCLTDPTEDRESSSYYLWHADSPLYRVPGGTFDPAKAKLAMEFALRAILAQPADYARAVGSDFLRTFRSRLDDYPSASVTRHYLFDTPPPSLDGRSNRVEIEDDLRSYGHGDFVTRSHEPAASWISWYQRHVNLPAPLIGVVLAVGTLALAVGLRRRRECSRLALVLMLAVLSLLLPPMTAGFDYRYVPPALPLIGLVLAFSLRATGVVKAGRGGLGRSPRPPSGRRGDPVPVGLRQILSLPARERDRCHESDNSREAEVIMPAKASRPREVVDVTPLHRAHP
ncbi:hypothetical protein I6A84_28595 [Frankia sp. CNm7]|uniref:Uncharacterized protein n=1 Tax=Frankia nepalensis TaxID=1836974 RepID=A0A937RIX7_9ACTN|nr:hypothetical protein [Frankia nepalensis]MBL7495327.1 hypothetical protein [Frankia nepalensis]MBL7516101.1 hypothetical protein [Frankia nepalensis]MBL7521932.1 hypothetical protein [Frankia nepalensis]MBL7633108.1 hypothetical protein [Frankia nepalensis]